MRSAIRVGSAVRLLGRRRLGLRPASPDAAPVSVEERFHNLVLMVAYEGTQYHGVQFVDGLKSTFRCSSL